VIVPRIVSDPPGWLRVAALAIILAALAQQLVDAHTVGNWLWAAAMALAAVLIGAGLVANWRRQHPGQGGRSPPSQVSRKAPRDS
jgi:hypothetical protein